MQGKWPMVVVSLIVVGAVGAAIAWRFAFFFAPYAWTEEPSRLQEVLGVQSSDRIADIGAGDGALAIEMARLVGPGGLVYATEISAERREDIVRRGARAGGAQVRVVEAAADATNLPAAGCDAVYMRAVFHHIQDQGAFAKAVTAALKPGGRVAIIDFAPGALWFHGSEHGVTPEQVTAAYQGAGLSLTRRIDDWGGGMFLLLFQR